MDFKKTIEECPVCKVFVDFIEETACTLLKRVNPNLDVDACKRLLKMRLEGKSVEEIAKDLGVPTDVLKEAVSRSIDLMEQVLDEVEKGRKK